jgi:hypothetical protein
MRLFLENACAASPTASLNTSRVLHVLQSEVETLVVHGAVFELGACLNSLCCIISFF